MAQATNKKISKYFTEQDFADKSTGEYIPMTKTFLDKLDALVTYLKLKRSDINIHSGGRTPAHNAEVGGVSDSRHLYMSDVGGASAVDIEIKGYSPSKIASVGKALGFTGIGVYTNDNFTHLDTRPGNLVTWGDSFSSLDNGLSLKFSDYNPPTNIQNVSTSGTNKKLPQNITTLIIISLATIFLILTVLKSTKGQDKINIVKG